MAHGYGRRFSNNSKFAAANGGHVKRRKEKPEKHKTKPLCNSCKNHLHLKAYLLQNYAVPNLYL